MSTKERRKKLPKAPQGKNKFKWYGPGLLWMISSVGSGSVLFTPRVGAKFGYEFLWMALIFMFFMWVMIREIGRYTVVTGKTIFEGFRDISGSSGWALYFILLPQILAAVVTIAGIAALAGSAMQIAIPWTSEAYAAGLIVLCLILVISGTYSTIEKVTSFLAIILVLAVIASAISVFPGLQKLGSGIVPTLPSQSEISFVIPWVGFILAGASGIMWFSYWVAARGYGGSLADVDEVKNVDQRQEKKEIKEHKRTYRELKSWFRIMGRTAAIGVTGGGLILLSFLILGAELLQPEGTIPEGIKVAEDLTKLLSEVWGNFGRWILIVGILIALLGTIISCQDGYGRMFADGTTLIAIPALKKKKMLSRDTPTRATAHAEPRKDLKGNKKKFISTLLDRSKLRIFYAVLFGAIAPLIVFFLVKKPVDILSIAGTVAAAHTPVVVFLTLYLNRKHLPSPLRPGTFTLVSMWLSGIAYGAFAVYHFTTMGSS